jgi:hypothetical protein
MSGSPWWYSAGNVHTPCASHYVTRFDLLPAHLFFFLIMPGFVFCDLQAKWWR